jgi:hypothetical protein
MQEVVGSIPIISTIFYYTDIHRHSLKTANPKGNQGVFAFLPSSAFRRIRLQPEFLGVASGVRRLKLGVRDEIDE